MALAVVRDLREQRALAGPEELVEFETDVLAGFGSSRDTCNCGNQSILNSAELQECSQARGLICS